MPVSRVLDDVVVTTLDDHERAGGLAALRASRDTEPAASIDAVAASGLRGRGGAGFPTGTKWSTVADNARSSGVAPTVVVNAAEGEPGTFGDRAIIRANPWRVLEGALIAAHAIGASSVIAVTKSNYDRTLSRLVAAADDLMTSGAAGDVHIGVIGAPSHYLLGEETGLLEAAAGRPPFPRLAPPFRHGATEAGDPSGGPASLDLAGPDGVAPPTLVNNVETFAHVPGIVMNGPEWFREHGTDESPGTSVFTVSGLGRAGVAEFPLGTPVAEILRAVGGIDPDDVAFVLSGIANGVLRGAHLDVPATHDALDAAGSGLGTGGFMVFGHDTDPVAVAAAVSRFLAVESCGQCTPCKQTGLDVADLLDRLRTGDAPDDATEMLADGLREVPIGARCDLGRQHERVVGSLLAAYPERFAARSVDGHDLPSVPLAPIVDIVDGDAILDAAQTSKQPDWSHADRWDGRSPADVHDVAVSIS